MAGHNPTIDPHSGRSEIAIRQLKPETDLDKRLYEDFLQLRNQVLRVPIGLDLFQEDLSKEPSEQIALIATVDNHEKQVVGCVMLVPDDKSKVVKLRQMAVSPSHQGQGIGCKLLLAAENLVKENHPQIHLHARKEAVPFYQKFGYHLVSLHEFLEVGIPHFAMTKQL